MNPEPSLDLMTNEQKIESILFYARTFRKHPLILFGKKEISPYDLACNGFVNKHFKEDEKQGNIEETNLKQVICVCRVPQCSKTLKFNSLQNEKYKNEDDKQEIQEMLTEHDENCSFYKKGFNKLSVSQLFNTGQLLFNKSYESFKKDSNSTVQSLKIDWKLIEKYILEEMEFKRTMTVLLQCYKWLDHQFCISTKRFSRTIILSLFGWKLQSFVENNSVVLKCHFCSKKVEKEVGDSFDFFSEHNLWCLIRKKEYQLWKLMLKKKYTKEKGQSQINKKTHQFVLPKSRDEIQSKQIREEIFEITKPILQKIDELMEESLEFVKKQRNFDEEIKTKSNGEKLYQTEEYIEKHMKLDEISKKCQEIIKNFINSIEPTRN